VCLLATGSPEGVVFLYPCIKFLLVGVPDARTNKGSRLTIASHSQQASVWGGGRRHMLSPNGTHFASISWIPLICREKVPHRWCQKPSVYHNAVDPA